jgi:hypothetical protein
MTRLLWLALIPFLSSTQAPPPVAELVAGHVRASSAFDAAALAGRESLPVPGVVPRPGLASPTRVPWVQTNGSRYLKNRTGKFSYVVTAGKGALAVAEALAYGGDAVIKFDPADTPAVERVMAFGRELPAVDLPDVADFGVFDDGSPLTAEAMNLFVRRNLLFARLTEPSSRYPFIVKLGTPEYPAERAADPSAFALEIRRKLTDEQRSLRLYGSEVAIARLTADPARARVHLVNYSNRELVGLRLRIRGAYPHAQIFLPGQPAAPIPDVTVTDGFTEFSMPAMQVCAVIDLGK